MSCEFHSKFSLLKKRVRPESNLGEAVASGLEACQHLLGSRLKMVRVSNEECPRGVSFNKGTRIGTKDHVVEMEQAEGRTTFESLFARLSTLEEDAQKKEKKINTVLKPQLRNMATQVVLLIAYPSDSQLRVTTGRRFQEMDTPRFERLMAALGFVTGHIPGDARQALDDMISRRNAETHPPSLPDLIDDVASLVDCITPELETACKWECLVLKCFEKISDEFRTEWK